MDIHAIVKFIWYAWKVEVSGVAGALEWWQRRGVGRRGTVKGGWEQREGLRCQGEQLHFEVRPVLLEPSEHKPGHQAFSVREMPHALSGGGEGN